jgi:hypothetical protein
MEGKSVMPMEITFMGMEDKHLKYGTLRSLRYIYSNPFRFLISSLGSPIFFLGIAERERWQNIPPMTAHQTDRIVSHNKLFHYFTATQSTSSYQFFHHIPMTNPLIYWSVHQPGSQVRIQLG